MVSIIIFSAPPLIQTNIEIETLEKFAQRDVQSMKDLMEVVCVWIAIKEPLRVYVGDAAFTQLEEMFMTGTLDFIFIPSQANSKFNLGVPVKKYIYIGTGLETTKKSMK